MPAAIPFVAAAFSVAEGVALVSAGSALLGGLMVAGGALTAVGALTGNQKLGMIGGVLSLAGGIGNAVSQASSAAEAAKVADSAYGAAANRGADTLSAMGAADDTAAAVANTSAEAASSGTASLPGDYGGTIGSEMAKAPSNFNPVPGAGDAQPVGLIDSASSSNVPTTAARADLAGGTYGPGATPAAPAASIAAPDGSSLSWWDKAKQMASDTSSWMKANPETTKLAGGLVQGAMGYYGQQQLADDNLKRQMKYQDWIRQRYSDSVRNLQIPSPLSTTTQPQGIISGSRG